MNILNNSLILTYSYLSETFCMPFRRVWLQQHEVCAQRLGSSYLWSICAARWCSRNRLFWELVSEGWAILQKYEKFPKSTHRCVRRKGSTICRSALLHRQGAASHIRASLSISLWNRNGVPVSFVPLPGPATRNPIQLSSLPSGPQDTTRWPIHIPKRRTTIDRSRRTNRTVLWEPVRE